MTPGGERGPARGPSGGDAGSDPGRAETASNGAVTAEEIGMIFTGALDVDPSGEPGGLLEDGRVDSLTLVDLLLELEERYGVEFSAEDLDPAHFESLEAIADLVNRRRRP